MLQQKASVCFEKLPEALRQPLGQRLDGFIDDQPVSISPPCSRILRRRETEAQTSQRDACAPPCMLSRQSLHSAIPLRRDSPLSDRSASGRRQNKGPALTPSTQRTA